MDLETHLRRCISLWQETNTDIPTITNLRLNHENRPQFEMGGLEFISFGDQVRLVEKPATQVAGVQGIDAHGPMGAR